MVPILSPSGGDPSAPPPPHTLAKNLFCLCIRPLLTHVPPPTTRSANLPPSPTAAPTCTQ